MFGSLSLALNMQKVSRGKQPFESSPVDIHRDCRGKIDCVHVKWIFKIK